MHVGLFGGSFNPPHIGHLVIAETIREAFAMESVWWVPAYRPPHKPAVLLAPYEDRLRMVQLATADQPAFAVCEIERELGGVSYTIDTIRALQERFPDHRFSLIVGEDSYATFDAWRTPEEILARVELVVYRRHGSDGIHPVSVDRSRVRFADAPRIEVASAAIRERCRSGFSIRYLVPEPVRTYLTEHRLYPADSTG